MKTVSVSEFGAQGKFIDDDTVAFQAALDSGAQTVTVAAGFYKISKALKVDSGQTIQADANAVIKLADHAGTCHDHFLLTNKKDATNITVDGGVWDGNCGNNPRGEEYEQGAYGGVAVNFTHCSDVTLRNMKIRNAESYSIRIGNINQFHIENITVQNDVIRPNQDGIHVGGCSKNGVIKNIRSTVPMCPNDDMIALNADDDVNRHFNQGLACGPIANIMIDGVEALSAYTFVRLLSDQAEISNIHLNNIKGHCTHCAVNLNNWRFAAGTGNIHDIIIENIEVGTIGSQGLPLFMIRLNVNNLMVKNVKRLDVYEAIATVEIANESINLFTFTGLTAEQTAVAQQQSPTSLILEEGEQGEHISVTTNTDGIFKLPGGGFDSLVMNLSSTPGSCKCKCS